MSYNRLGLASALLTLFVLSHVVHALEIDKPYFYRLERDQKVSYILGTMHVGVSLMDLPMTILELSVRADVVLVEASPTLGKEMSAAESDQTENIKIKDVLTKDELESLMSVMQPYFEERFYGSAMVDVFRNKFLNSSPMQANGQLWQMLNSAASGPMANESLDEEISAKAEFNSSRSTRLFGMDTVELRRACYEAARLRSVEALKASIKVLKEKGAKKIIAEITANNERLLNIYRSGDETLVRDVNSGLLSDPASYEACNAARNRYWVDNYIAGGLTAHDRSRWLFVAVGVKHLVGPNNVLELLRKRGFIVTRVTDFEGITLEQEQKLGIPAEEIAKRYHPDHYRIHYGNGNPVGKDAL
jgi:uncharacterized protein YbaP (TraB family)